MDALYNEVLEALFREAGRIAVDQEQHFLHELQDRINNLDSDGTEALNRLIRTFPTRHVTQQTRADLKTLALKLRLMRDQVNSIVPSNVRHSSFGLVFGVNGAYVAGAEVSYSLLMNTSGNDQSVAFTESLGGTLGLEVGAAALIGIVWAPGTIDDAAGSSVGFGVSGAAGEGAGVGLSWSVSNGMSGAWNAVPSFTLAFDGGAEVSAAFSGGYTLLLGKY